MTSLHFIILSKNKTVIWKVSKTSNVPYKYSISTSRYDLACIATISPELCETLVKSGRTLTRLTPLLCRVGFYMPCITRGELLFPLWKLWLPMLSDNFTLQRGRQNIYIVYSVVLWAEMVLKVISRVPAYKLQITHYLCFAKVLVNDSIG